MLVARPIKFRKRRAKARAASEQRPPAAAPVLVSASFEASELLLTLVFDRAVTIGGAFEGTSVAVRDGDNLFDGAGGVIQLDPVTITVGMVLQDVQPGTGTTLTATDATGIVAATGGAAWAGATDLELPYP